MLKISLFLIAFYPSDPVNTLEIVYDFGEPTDMAISDCEQMAQMNNDLNDMDGHEYRFDCIVGGISTIVEWE